jgi:hypothetical protein
MKSENGSRQHQLEKKYGDGPEEIYPKARRYCMKIGLKIGDRPRFFISQLLNNLMNRLREFL